jgi:predicted RNA binding protein YcfA (HicA-like mRNA interferase family)
MKVREVIALLEEDGWYLDRTRGSHRQLKHPRKRGLVTVPGKLNKDLHPKTLASILSQAQLEKP